MREIIPAEIRRFSIDEQRLLKTKPPSGWFEELFHTTDGYTFFQTLFAPRSLFTKTTEVEDFEPKPGERYNASEFGALYDCANYDRMITGELREEVVTVTGPDGKAREERRVVGDHLNTVHKEIDALILEAGLHLAESSMHKYVNPEDPNHAKAGYTYHGSLTESAFEINTWPDEDGNNYVDFNIHVCCTNEEGLRHDEKFQTLYALLQKYYGAPNVAITTGVRKLPMEDPRKEN